MTTVFHVIFLVQQYFGKTKNKLPACRFPADRQHESKNKVILYKSRQYSATANG
jgi:hypothetical protein